MTNTPTRAYFAAGLNHDVCVVIPEWEMVVVRMGTDHHPPDGHAVTRNRFVLSFESVVRPGQEDEQRKHRQPEGKHHPSCLRLTADSWTTEYTGKELRDNFHLAVEPPPSVSGVIQQYQA